MSLIKELQAAIVDPDNVDSIPTTVPQGLIRRSIMEIQRLQSTADLLARHDKALPAEDKQE